MGQAKTILITGTSKGIGKHMAEYYCSQGFSVIGCSRSDCDISHHNYTHFRMDITNEAEVLSMFREVKQRYSRIDVVINNAAINPAILSAALVPVSVIETVYRTNVFAPMVLCREAVKMMFRHKFGRIINLGSMATKHEVPGESVYTSTKAALIAYSRVLSKEVAKSNITVNVVAPSAIRTELSAKINQDSLQEVLSRNAINSYGDFADVTNVVDLLIKDESKSITGQVIYLGGV
jgi:3-oxoacyl-[acyl-carrier protein] reductase